MGQGRSKDQEGQGEDKNHSCFICSYEASELISGLQSGDIISAILSNVTPFKIHCTLQDPLKSMDLEGCNGIESDTILIVTWAI